MTHLADSDHIAPVIDALRRGPFGERLTVQAGDPSQKGYRAFAPAPEEEAKVARLYIVRNISDVNSHPVPSTFRKLEFVTGRAPGRQPDYTPGQAPVRFVKLDGKRASMSQRLGRGEEFLPPAA